MIITPSENFRKGIIELWQEAFGDSEDFITDFLNEMNYKKNMLIGVKNNKVAAMLFFLPVFCGGIKGRYIYAVATKKEYRNQGLCKALMSAAESYIIKSGESFTVLVPQNEELFSFYEKLGYNQTIFQPSFPKKVSAEKICGVEEYYLKRNEIFKNVDLIGWKKRELDYILKFGKIVKNEHGIFYTENGIVKEALTELIFENEWKTRFALLKYLRSGIEFINPYFGLCIN